MMIPSDRPLADSKPMLDRFARRHRLDPREALPWIVAVAGYIAFPDYLALQAQILATIVFALSVDLLLGYAGLWLGAFRGPAVARQGLVLAAIAAVTGVGVGGTVGGTLGLLAGIGALAIPGVGGSGDYQ